LGASQKFSHKRWDYCFYTKPLVETHRLHYNYHLTPNNPPTAGIDPNPALLGTLEIIDERI
jgi:hypothetical protein